MCCQGIAPASLLKYVSGKNPLMLIAQIYNFTLDARELTRPMCLDLSRVARAAIACRVSYVFSALVSSSCQGYMSVYFIWPIHVCVQKNLYDFPMSYKCDEIYNLLAIREWILRLVCRLFTIRLTLVILYV